MDKFVSSIKSGDFVKDSLGDLGVLHDKKLNNKNGLTDFITDNRTPFNFKSQNNTSIPFNKSDYQLNKTNPDEIFGLPQYETGVLGTGKKVLQSTMVAEIIPGYPADAFNENPNPLNLFKIDRARGIEKLESILKIAGIDGKYIKKDRILVAVLNDTSIVHSFSNDFGDSIVEQGIDSLGQKNRDLMAHGINLPQLLSKGVEKYGNIPIPLTGGKSANDLMSAAAAEVDKAGLGSVMKGMKSYGTKVLSGSRIDFPAIWQGSSYSPSFTFTTRLYNPDPENEEAYMKFIVSPLAHFLALTNPISEDAFSFNIPLLISFSCPGLCALEGAYISNLDVVMGGDNNDISFWQRPGQVDIRFTISSLYNSMINLESENEVADERRPTIRSFVKSITGYAIPPSTKDSAEEAGVSFSENFESIISKGTPINDFKNDTGPISNISNILDVGIERISVLDRIRSSNPMLLLSNTTELTANVISNINNYKNEIDELLSQSGGTLDIAMDVSLRLKNNIPVEPEIQSWFWNNLDRFNDNILTNIATVPLPDEFTEIIDPILTTVQNGILNSSTL
jgi:hypothetical protein